MSRSPRLIALAVATALTSAACSGAGSTAALGFRGPTGSTPDIPATSQAAPTSDVALNSVTATAGSTAPPTSHSSSSAAGRSAAARTTAPKPTSSTKAGKATPTAPPHTATPSRSATGRPSPTQSEAPSSLPQGMSEDKAKAAGMGTDGAPVVTVTATDTQCQADRAAVPAGAAWFKIVNQGSKINELYLTTAAGTKLIEVEDVAAGQAAAFKWNVSVGSYRLSCLPGMAALEIATPLTVNA